MTADFIITVGKHLETEYLALVDWK